MPEHPITGQKLEVTQNGRFFASLGVYTDRTAMERRLIEAANLRSQLSQSELCGTSISIVEVPVNTTGKEIEGNPYSR
jgi:hypothetical protein